MAGNYTNKAGNLSSYFQTHNHSYQIMYSIHALQKTIIIKIVMVFGSILYFINN